MSDRLVEIEAWVAHPTPEPWDRGQVYADLRDLLAVAKAANTLMSTAYLVQGRWDADWADFQVAEDALRAALANLEGDA